MRWKISGSSSTFKIKGNAFENVENWKGSISHAWWWKDKFAVLNTQYSWQCMCRFNHDCWTSYILLEVPQASKELQVVDTSCHVIKKWHVYLPNSLWIRLKGKTWYYNHYIHLKDVTLLWVDCPLNWCWNSPLFLEGKWTRCCRWLFPCASVSVVQRIWNSGIRSVLGQVSCVHIHICVHACIQKRSAKSHDIHNWRYLSLNLLFISILFICFTTHFEAHLYCQLFWCCPSSSFYSPVSSTSSL